MYVSYKCDSCNISFMIPKTDLQMMADKGRYIACPFGHRTLKMIDRYAVCETDMKHDSYTRKRGRVVQKGWG